MSTPTTRRYPRTLQEAFGPHTSREVLPAPTSRKPLTLAQILYLPAIVALIAWALF